MNATVERGVFKVESNCLIETKQFVHSYKSMAKAETNPVLFAEELNGGRSECSATSIDKNASGSRCHGFGPNVLIKLKFSTTCEKSSENINLNGFSDKFGI